MKYTLNCVSWNSLEEIFQCILAFKNFSENKNHDVNENFKARIKFGAYIFYVDA